MSVFGKFPHEPLIPVKPFTAHCPDGILDDLRDRLKHSLPPKRTYENTTETKYGITREWLVEAIHQWKAFDWRKIEEESNAFPNFMAHLSHNGKEYDLHFAALFSERQDAVPVVMIHGWPGSFLEFTPMLKLLSTKYTLSTLPIHLIVPSLIGYGYSSPPPVDVWFGTKDNALLIDKLMEGLGLNGYVAQGGDIGAFVSRYIAQNSSTCAGVHLNMFSVPPPQGFDTATLDAVDQICVKKSADWENWDRAYVMEHSTKPATIAAVVESSPVALLSWVGEKWLAWADETPSTQSVLSVVTLYWVTNTFATSLYPYRIENMPPPLVKTKPLGYSQFVQDIKPAPRALVEANNNLVWHRRHERVGHFAAWENAEVLWNDVWDFIQTLNRP